MQHILSAARFDCQDSTLVIFVSSVAVRSNNLHISETVSDGTWLTPRNRHLSHCASRNIGLLVSVPLQSLSNANRRLLAGCCELVMSEGFGRGSQCIKILDGLAFFVGGGMKLSNRLAGNYPAKPSRSSKRPTDLPRDDMYPPSLHNPWPRPCSSRCFY